MWLRVGDAPATAGNATVSDNNGSAVRSEKTADFQIVSYSIDIIDFSRPSMRISFLLRFRVYHDIVDRISRYAQRKFPSKRQSVEIRIERLLSALSDDPPIRRR